ncbi:hypothetical protein BC628DRAFT_1330585, partial [Trametes gibbosa]
TILEVVTKHFSKHQDKGLMFQKNPNLTSAIVVATLAHWAHTAFEWVKDHNGHPGNEKADALAEQGACKTSPDTLDHHRHTTPESSVFAPLCPRAQALNACKPLCTPKSLPSPPSFPSLCRLCEHAQIPEDLNIYIALKTLWKSLGKEVILQEVRQWIWMTLHGAYMAGMHWLQPNMSDELKERVVYKICRQTKTIEHILFTCMAQGHKTIWLLLKHV